MKKIRLWVFSLMALCFCISYVHAQSASEMIASAVNGVVTLESDNTLDNTLTINSASNITTIDLNNHTLTLKSNIKIEGKEVVIKNGTIKRDSSFTSGSLIVATGSDTNLTLEGITIDGNNISTSSSASALNVSGISSIKFNSTIVKNNNGTRTIMVTNSGNLEFDANSQVIDNVGIRSNFRIQDTDATIAGTISSNEVTGDGECGGGLYTYLTDEKYTITITNTAKIINNIAAGGGGGIVITSDRTTKSGKVIIDGATITGNRADGNPDPLPTTTLKDIGGAGIFVARGNLEIRDVVLKDNVSTSGIATAIAVSNVSGSGPDKNENGGNLVIKDGTIIGSISLAEGYGSINIYGGNYSNDVTGFLAKNNIKCTKTNSGYVVEEIKSIATTDEKVIFESDTTLQKDYVLTVDEKQLTKEANSSIEEIIKKNEKNVSIKDTKVLAFYDISVMNGNTKVEMSNGNYVITLTLDESLLNYNTYKVVYVKDGEAKEVLDASLDGNKLQFATTHLSDYAIIGYNVESTTKNPVTSDINIKAYIILTVVSAICSLYTLRKAKNY